MIRAVLVFAATLAGGWAFPWWWPVVPGLVAGAWRPGTARHPALTAAVGGGVAWAAVAAWIDWRNGGVLSARIAPLFHLPGGWALIAVTALIGGVTAALGAWAGLRLRGAYRRSL